MVRILKSLIRRALTRHKSVVEREKIKEMEKHRTELNDKGKFISMIRYTFKKIRDEIRDETE